MHPLSTSALSHDHAALARAGDRTSARDVLLRYAPCTEEQRATQGRILSFLGEHANALERACVPGHLTASTLLIDSSGERALLTLHAKLGRWLQLGGHCDGDGNLARAALREAQEESGIVELSIHPVPVDLDIHTIPARPGEPEHLHLDTRFLAFAPPGARAARNEESRSLRWVTSREARELDSDASVRRLFDLAF